MWGVGCIFAEICTGQALFPGIKDVDDQLDKIFSVRGLPNETHWPQVKHLPHYSPQNFPPYKEVPFKQVNILFTKLQKSGNDLLAMFLQLKPEDRISASCAMLHPYFAGLPRNIHILPPIASIFSLPELQLGKR